MTANPAVSCRDLTRTFPSGTALDGLSFDLAPGEVLALLGPNGAGKTTTVRLLNGVLTPNRGMASVLGFDPATEGDEVRRRTGVLTENAGLDDRLTTRENLEFTARLRGFDPAGARRRVDEMLERFGMTDRAEDLTQGFSTGQRKRVALARALLHDPEVLFLDEPTSGLDPAGTRDVADLISGLADEGRTIILATHFLGEAGRLADRMAVLHRGRLRAYGRPAQLAADLWEGIAAEIELGRAATPDLVTAAAAIDGVLAAGPVAGGLELRIRDRDVLPVVVRAAVDAGADVFGAAARPPTLEDVYFEIEGRIITEEGGATDGFLGVERRYAAGLAAPGDHAGTTGLIPAGADTTSGAPDAAGADRDATAEGSRP